MTQQHRMARYFNYEHLPALLALITLVGCGTPERNIEDLQRIQRLEEQQDARRQQLEDHAKADSESVARAEAHRQAQADDLAEAQKYSAASAALSQKAQATAASEDPAVVGVAIEQMVGAQLNAQAAAEFEKSAAEHNREIGAHLAEMAAREQVSASIRSDARRDAQLSNRINQSILAREEEHANKLALAEAALNMAGGVIPGLPKISLRPQPQPVQPVQPATPPAAAAEPQPAPKADPTPAPTPVIVKVDSPPATTTQAAPPSDRWGIGDYTGPAAITAILLALAEWKRRQAKEKSEERVSNKAAEKAAAKLHAVNGNGKPPADDKKEVA